jgi:hypothetical protein
MFKAVLKGEAHGYVGYFSFQNGFEYLDIVYPCVFPLRTAFEYLDIVYPCAYP